MTIDTHGSQASILLLSGGLDSTVNAAIATVDHPPKLALTFDYGQKAAAREIASSKAISAHLGIDHKILNIKWLGDITTTALVRQNQVIPTPEVEFLDNAEESSRTADAVWVPNRNGIFLNIAAAYAETLDCQLIIPGFNAEEARTFPDNSIEYMEALNQAFHYSTRGTVRVHCFTAHLAKIDVFRKAREVDAPVWLSWSCYLDGEAPCGRCESCMRFNRALRESGCEPWFRERMRR